MSELVYSVEKVVLSILKSNPPILVVQAYGQVTSTGWTKPQLHPVQYVKFPENGIWEFTFKAEPPPPETIRLPQLQPIIAPPYEWRDFPTELKGVQITAATGSMTELLTEKAVHIVLAPGAVLVEEQQFPGIQDAKMTATRLLESKDAEAKRYVLAALKEALEKES